jgi:hypothetical protein
VNSPIEWKHSSFRSMVEKGFYPEDWGGQVNEKLIEMDYE